MMEISGSIASRRRYLVSMYLATVATACFVSSCGGDDAAPRANAGDAGSDVFVPAEANPSCGPFSDAGEPQVSTALASDGGVPLDQLAFSVAVARCTYWSKCSPLAPYLVSECIDAMSQRNTWHFGNCTGSAADYSCQDQTIAYPFPSPALFRAIDAGMVRYDPEEERTCLQALSAQSCHGDTLWENVPACTGVFTCLSDAGVGDSTTGDGALVDGSPGCSALLDTNGQSLLPCSTASDCADAGLTADPYCFDGYCAPKSCGSFGGDCPAFVEAGEPCDSDPPVLGNGLFATPGRPYPTRICSPGLTCAGVASDGGLGVCLTPQDIGGSCSGGSTNTGCSVGLTCQCGVCELPPSRGPCASGSCQTGVAYCDVQSGTCKPVGQIGDDCASLAQACAPSLKCDDKTSTCQVASISL